MKNLLYIIIVALSPMAMAGGIPFEYQIGVVKISENDRKIVVNSTPPVAVSILPGGTTWPPLSIDEGGNIYAGNIVIDGATGTAVMHPKATLALPHGVEMSETHDHLQFRHNGKNCSFSLQQLGLNKQRTALAALKNSNIKFSSTATALLALVTQFGPDGRVSNYRVEQLDLGLCRISFFSDMGNPDLLVESGHSAEGGWWMTGSIEQTLMQSGDGRHWRKAVLPRDLSSLISAYVVNPREIWLAAMLPADEAESPYLLVYSGDGGKSWRNVVADDRVLERLPSGWLEGQKRRPQ